MNSVLPRSTARSIALICAGSVLSSMWKRGQPDCGPKVSPRTSGPRLEPPMPSRTKSVNPRFFMFSAKPCSRSTSASSSSTMLSQPSHLSSSVPVHRVLSPAQRRRMRPVFAPDLHFLIEGGLQRRESPARSRSGRDRLRAACGAAARWRRNSLSNESANCCTPSATSSSVISFSEMPCCSSSASIARAPATSCSMASGVALPWSRNASMVAGGIVSTVSRPTSASTYIVSL